MSRGPSGPTPQKSLRIGVHSERAAVNAVRTLLEAKGLVVDEVDGRSDYGRDLNVDLTRDNKLTGGVIGVQVKGGKSYFRQGQWVVPASPADWAYWRSSTVPIIGIVHDPDTNDLRWRNLTEAARARVLQSENWISGERQSDETTEVAVADILAGSTFDSFLDVVTRYLAATSDSAHLLLVEEADELRRLGVFNCWTVGRHDPRALVLLRRVLPSLEGRSLLDAISVLAHVTPHPDVLWHRQNWITPSVAEVVRATFHWLPSELFELVRKTENLGVGWERGGLGQSIWMLLTSDRTLVAKLPAAIRLAVEGGQAEAARRLLSCYQAVAATLPDDVEAIVNAHPVLLEDEFVLAIVETVRQEGRFALF